MYIQNFTKAIDLNSYSNNIIILFMIKNRERKRENSEIKELHKRENILNLICEKEIAVEKSKLN